MQMCRGKRRAAEYSQPILVQHLAWEMSFKQQFKLPDEQQAHLKWEVPAHLEWEVSMKGGSKVPVKTLKEPVGVPIKCHIQTRGDSRGSPGQGGAESSSRGSCESAHSRWHLRGENSESNTVAESSSRGNCATYKAQNSSCENCERKKRTKLRAANKIPAAIETQLSVVQVGTATQATSRVVHAGTAKQRSPDQDRIPANHDMADVAVMEHPQGPRMGTRGTRSSSYEEDVTKLDNLNLDG